MKHPILIGLVGEKGSGKETVGKLIISLLPNTKVSHIKFSDLLKETLALWSIPSTRTNLQQLAVVMDTHFGDGTLAHAVFERIKSIHSDIVIIDGIRWEADIELLHRFSRHYLIYVTADIETRFARVQRRIEKIGEGKDFKQFMKEERAKNELMIPKIGKIANYKIENNGNLEQLKLEVSTIIQKICPS